MARTIGSKDKVRRKFVNSFARQYLADHSIRMFSGEKSILSPINEQLYNIKLPNTHFIIGEQFSEQGEIKKIASFEELKSLGFTIISVQLNQSTRWETGQKVRYELRRIDETGEHLNKIPRDHYIEFDNYNKALRLIGPRAGRLSYGPWVRMQKKKEYQGGGAERQIHTYTENADEILEKRMKRLRGIEDEAQPVNIKEAAFMITHSNEIVCLPNTPDMPSIIVSGMKGSGKCIVQDEDSDFVLDDHGRCVKIKDRPEKVKILGKDFQFKTAKVKEYMNRRVKKTIKITSKTGREIRVTPEHPFLTVTGWKEAKDLKKDECVAVVGKLEFNNRKTMPENQLKLIAYALTRGKFHTGKTVLFKHKYFDVNEDIENAVTKFDKNLYFDGNKVLSSKKKNKLTQFYKKHGLFRKTLAEMCIPNSIMELDNKSIKKFLSAYFTYAGIFPIATQMVGFRFVCKSKAVARQIKHLLLRFGIVTHSKIMETKDGNYAERIHSFNRDTTKQFIKIFKPFLDIHKEYIKINLPMMVTRGRPDTNDIVPKDIWKITRPKDHNRVAKQLGYYHPHKTDGWLDRDMTRTNFKRIAKGSDNIMLQQIANSDIIWDKITNKEVNTGDWKVWDMEIDDEAHNFIANDFVVHNSFAVHSLVSRLFWKPAYDYKIAILNDSSREAGTWNLPNQDPDQIHILKRLNEKPLPLPCVYLHPLVKEQYEKLFMGDVGFDVTIPFKEIVKNHKEYLNLKESARYFTKVANELLECKSEKEAQELLDGLGLKFQIPPQTVGKIRAEFDTLFDSKMTDISTDGQAPWSTSKRKGKNYNPLTAAIHAGVLPVLETEFISNYRQLLSIYFTYFVKDLFNRQKQDPDFLEEKSEVLLVIDEAHNISQKGIKSGADMLLRRCVREGRPRRIGTLLATQKFNELPDVIKDNTTFLVCFKNVGEASEIVNQYNMGKHMVNTIRDLGKHECIAYTTEHFVIYDTNGKKRKSKLNEVFIGKTLPPYSQHKKPNA